MIEEGWTFVRDGKPRIEGGTDYCWCPVVRKEHADGSVSEMQSLLSPGENCPWHGLRPCRGCHEMVWDGGSSHYVSSVGHLSDPGGAIAPYYRCQKPAVGTGADAYMAGDLLA